jgi:hypothetical protein|tara:strand:- start:1321 stop:1578 length:258 start_codon:yes stop_codon:yes gene_type:complete
MGLTGYKHQVDHTLVHLTDKTRLHHYLNETAQRCVIAAATTIIKDTTSVRRFGYLLLPHVVSQITDCVRHIGKDPRVSFKSKFWP